MNTRWQRCRPGPGGRAARVHREAHREQHIESQSVRRHRARSRRWHTYTYKKGTADTMLVQTRGDEVGVGGPARSTTSQGYNAIDELTSLNGSTAGLSYDGNGNQKTNPGNSAVGCPR